MLTGQYKYDFVGRENWFVLVSVSARKQICSLSAWEHTRFGILATTVVVASAAVVVVVVVVSTVC